MEKEENRKEKLVRLLAENKTRLARDKLVSKYRQEINYNITADQFVDLTVSHSMKKAAYQKISMLQSQKIVNFQQLLSTIKDLKKQSSEYNERLIVLYYMDTLYTGGVYIKMKDFWNILDQIENQLLSDIVVIEENLAFGLCVEVEEYDYLLTWWGFERG